MKITLLCSDPMHPVNPYLEAWKAKAPPVWDVELVREKAQATGGDILFLISCSEIVNSKDRAQYGACLVLHASDLPSGRGWSPHIWELANSADSITLTLLDAEDKVDSGAIWCKVSISIPKNFLWDEINHKLFQAEVDLINYAIENYGLIKPTMQPPNMEATYYRRRTQGDSAIDPNKTIAEQFDLIRVCDPNRFPAYFEYLGRRYLLKVEKDNGQ